jgi:enamine deaminase RidA (YjgF/YER057c/UK114 family)
MIEVVDTGLARTPGAPLNGTVRAGDMVFTSQIPKHPETAAVILGDIKVQALRLFENFRQSMEAAGGSLADVIQVTIYLVDPDDFPEVNRLYKEFFREPYPNRSTLVVKSLMVPGMRIEVLAQAYIPRPISRGAGPDR